ncbi:hypothetical protein [Caballeronia sp. NK8]|uniref:hypothetical protein n=1 Tax=Caballeronia sp. NK8 TaxID=140098 RepID=UPI001BD14E80|nr:hypothetical protein [Caballeronia sp. NK8]
MFITVRQSYDGVHASNAAHATDPHSNRAGEAIIGRKRAAARPKQTGTTDKTRFMTNRSVKTIIIALQCRTYRRVTNSSRNWR